MSESYAAPQGAPLNTAPPPPPPTGAPIAAASPAASAPPDASPTGAPVASAASVAAPPPTSAPVAAAPPPTDAPPPTGAPIAAEYAAASKPKDGIDKCPTCGSSDIQLNAATGLLHCNYCHREFSEVSDGIDGDISKLHGVTFGSAARDITFDASDVVTIKCTACGSEVVVDTSEAVQARCHWCRNTLSLNNQVPNGAVPDAIMPFRLQKEHAQQKIAAFVNKRRFFAHPRFRAEFNTNNIMGVYLPYMVIDVNAHANFFGKGEHLVRKYTVGTGDNKKTRYDADLYQVGREFELYIDDLTLEASAQRLEQTTSVNSNNIINAILPYPLKETLRFNANYLRGFSSEKRDVNYSQLHGLAEAQVRDIARFQAKRTAAYYDRGIKWEQEQVAFAGELWKTVYLPVWLYSYLEVRGSKRFLHYVAVNGCTGETMGSVPIHMPKLILTSAIVEIIGIIVGILLAVVIFFTS